MPKSWRSPLRHDWIPYNGKIADISEADVLKHTLDMQAALGDTREIVGAILYAHRVAGTGVFRSYPNEGVNYLVLGSGDHFTQVVIFADGTSRLQYQQTVANDDWDLYCYGYIVEQ